MLMLHAPRSASGVLAGGPDCESLCYGVVRSSHARGTKRQPERSRHPNTTVAKPHSATPRLWEMARGAGCGKESVPSPCCRLRSLRRMLSIAIRTLAPMQDVLRENGSAIADEKCRKEIQEHRRSDDDRRRIAGRLRRQRYLVTSVTRRPIRDGTSRIIRALRPRTRRRWR